MKCSITGCPGTERAVIAVDKLRDYLLNLGHRRGGSKARLLHSFGYDVAGWRRLEADIRAQHFAREVDCALETPYGQRYEIVAPLQTPCGRPLRVRTI